MHVSGHAKTPLLCYGLSFDWASPECVFNSVEAILKMSNFCAWDHGLVARAILFTASTGRLMALSSPANILITFVIYFSLMNNYVSGR